jgi:hypothetical protein
MSTFNDYSCPLWKYCMFFSMQNAECKDAATAEKVCEIFKEVKTK